MVKLTVRFYGKTLVVVPTTVVFHEVWKPNSAERTLISGQLRVWVLLHYHKRKYE
jgi:hypothetical protein